MADAITIRDGRFLRPRRSESKGSRVFHVLLARSLTVSLHLFLLSFFLLLGYQIYVRLLEDPAFRVKEIEVTGNEKIKREDIVSLVMRDGMPNLFALNLKAIARRLEAHPWIDRVALQKVFPDTISIHIQERKPVAIIEMDELYYIDSKGVIFSRVGDGDALNYPVVRGLAHTRARSVSTETKSLIARALELILTWEGREDPPFGGISEVIISGKSGLECFTKTEGIKIRMGWDRFGEKLERLSLVWSDLQRRRIVPVSIDSSNANAVTVKRSSAEGGKGRR